MSSHLLFRCQFCDATPDAETERKLGQLIRQPAFGAYFDVPPRAWLVWQGRGPLGPTRYACATHRGELTAYLREHYGSVAPHPWKRPPYPASARSADTERAIRQGALSSMPKWGTTR